MALHEQGGIGREDETLHQVLSGIIYRHSDDLHFEPNWDDFDQPTVLSLEGTVRVNPLARSIPVRLSAECTAAGDEFCIAVGEETYTVDRYLATDALDYMLSDGDVEHLKYRMMRTIWRPLSAALSSKNSDH